PAPVFITLKLLGEGTAWTVATRASGSIQVASLTRDGIPVAPEVTSFESIDGTRSPLRASLRKLDPGGVIEIPFKLIPDPTGTGFVLDVVTLEELPNPKGVVPARDPRGTLLPPASPKATKAAPSDPRVIYPAVDSPPEPANLHYVLVRPGTYVL